MRSILFAGAVAILAVPAVLSAQTPGTPPADPTGSNTASANLPPATPPASGSAQMQMGSPSTGTPSADTGATAPNAMPDTSSMPSTPKTYPVCSRTVHDECRNRGGK